MNYIQDALLVANQHQDIMPHLENVRNAINHGKRQKVGGADKMTTVKYTGYKTFDAMKKSQENLKDVIKSIKDTKWKKVVGSGWNSKDKHFFEVELND